MNIINLPLHNIADIPSCLRNLADAIEKGEYGTANHLAWVLDSEHVPVSVGLIGMCANPDAVATLLFECGKMALIKGMGK